MSSLNKAMIIGRLGQDPDVRRTQSDTAVANMSIATSERYKDKSGEWQEKTQWHKVVAWGRTAEICEQYLAKGSQVYIEGPIETSKWEDKEGNDRYTTEIKALTLTMIGGKGEVSSSPGKSTSIDTSSSAKMNDNLDDLDDDLPF